MIERLKLFLRKDFLKWPETTESPADKPRLSEQTKSNLLKVHIQNASK